jgi:glycosyltransferase involved in cell wall biosynthesis
MGKRKIVLHSNHCRMKTGFGKHMKHLLTHLHKNKKYEVVEFANGKKWNDPVLSMMPWKAYGSLPIEQNLVTEINSDQQKLRKAGYGHYKVDDLIKQEKPDIYLGIEDIWGLENFWKKNWWKKINSIIWTPIDSLPLLDKHLDGARNTQHIIVQASFAKKALEEKGLQNVHLMPVPLDTKNFYRLKNKERLELRSKFNINEDDFIIGFVFRNQLRKSVPNLLEGFRLFKNKNPDSKAKLLLHTHWLEGWDILKLITEKNISISDILTTYYCDKCKQYEIKPFAGQDLDCRFCGSKKSQQTAQVTRGVSEGQLNEIYNLMDVYCHPFTSGGQEIPIQEAKLTELITLVTNYSCGEDYSSQESGGLPLNWTEYREPGTQFIKASTSSNHISEQIEAVFNMSKPDRLKTGKRARDFVIDFCSIDSVCKKFTNLLDKIPPSSWDYDFSYVQKNPNYAMPDIQDDREWIIDLYKNILKVEQPEQEEENGIIHWQHRLKTDLNRDQVYRHFIKVAVDENSKENKIKFEDLLDKDDEGRRILFVMPESETDIFNSTSLLKYIKDQYPDHNIYFATKQENINILNGNPYIHRTVLYDDVMNNHLWSEGQSSYNGMFEFVLIPNGNTDKFKNYIHGNKHKIPYDLNYA